MKHLFHISFVFLFMSVLNGCHTERKTLAIGDNDKITIIADSSDYNHLEDVLENAFTPPIFTPQAESWFYLTRYNLDELLVHKKERNIVILAPLDATNNVGEFMRVTLDSAVRVKVRRGEGNVFIKHDLWYTGQTVMFLTGNSMENLRTFMVNQAQALQYYFKKAWDEREKERMISQPREEELENRLLEKYGWSLALIKGWHIGKDSAALKAVWLRRDGPRDAERWIHVHWIDTNATQLLNNSFVLSERNRLTEILYRTYDDKAYVKVDTVNYFQFDEVDFLGQFAISMHGLWQMNDFSMGGPFVSYTYYNASQQRIYILDGSVFAPRFEKKKLLQDVDVLLHTFRTGPINGKKKSDV